MVSFVCLQGGQAPTIVINGVMGPVSMAENKWVILIKTLLIGVITPDITDRPTLWIECFLSLKIS